MWSLPWSSNEVARMTGTVLGSLGVIVAVGASALLGGCSDDAAVQSSESDIIDGQDASEDAFDMVGVLLRVKADDGAESGVSYDPFCTATLIAPDLLLTAKHCVDDDPVEQLRFGIGADGFAPERVFEIAQIRLSSPIVVNEALQSAGDVALVTLATPIADLAPLPVAPLRPEHEGMPVTVIGYGYSEADYSERGKRRRGTATLAALLDDYEAHVGLEDESIVCNGDSGGPLLAEVDGQLTILGVAARTSLNPDSECSNPATYQRFAPTQCEGGIATTQIVCSGNTIARCDVGNVPGEELEPILDCTALTPAKVCEVNQCVAPASNSCVDHCGGPSADDSCHCDATCEQYGNCCADYASACT